MPKIFEYLGIIIFFYSNEHEPIHVHATHDSFESKAEFYIVGGEISEIRIKLVKDRKPLKGAKLKDFEKFLEVYADKIVQKWVDYFVYHKDVEFERITKKLK
ncbi:DUF4160 domain-containing protein [Mucilaginibacter sp. McL0603]|uniref:DUF4160 domain-containing protein n=1 Tax=Mucilaginibacter sp. McL0603 TaxID=3415670 RepID=UPI003CF099C9